MSISSKSFGKRVKQRPNSNYYSQRVITVICSQFRYLHKHDARFVVFRSAPFPRANTYKNLFLYALAHDPVASGHQSRERSTRIVKRAIFALINPRRIRVMCKCTVRHINRSILQDFAVICWQALFYK